MNKAELVKALSMESGLSKVDSEKALNSFICVVERTLSSGEDVTLAGFGTFQVKRSPEIRNGRNFKTGELMIIPSKNSVKFKVGKKLKDAVN